MISVVDVGASNIDSAPPYVPLLKRGLCQVLCFEPQVDFWPSQSEHVTCRPDVVGDGKEHTLYLSNAPGMTSLYRINAPIWDVLCPKRDGEKLVRVVHEKRVPTIRLNDIDVERIDFLKMDAQGAELMVIKGGHIKIMRALCVHTEVSFVPLYVGQPMFADIDQALGDLGFLFHSFCEFHIQKIGDGPGPSRQVTQADAVYFRDFTKIDKLSGRDRETMATIAELCYGSYDLAQLCRRHIDGHHSD
jgi:FkbM family methyltransferase